MQEELTFKIDCEWLCNFIRQRVYWEGMDFQWGLDTLKASFGDAISDEDAFAILTGTKKVVGINGGDLVKDDKFKNYIDYVARTERARKKQQLDDHKSLYPLNYVDPFATVWSYRKFKEMCDKDGLPVSYREVQNWFCRPPADEDSLFNGGLYSIQLAEIIVSSESDKERFYQQLYMYWKKELKETIYSKEDQKRIVQRNRSYEMWLEKKTGKTFAELESDVRDAEVVSIYSDEEVRERERAKRPRWVISDENTYNLCYGQESYYQRNAKFIPTEPGVFHDYGIIAPNGDFYACDFASHELAACIICSQNGYFGSKPEDMDERAWRATCDFDYRSKAKDILYDRGYVFVNSAYGFGGTFYSKWGAMENMPQRIMDTCFDYDVWERNFKLKESR